MDVASGRESLVGAAYEVNSRDSAFDVVAILKYQKTFVWRRGTG